MDELQATTGANLSVLPSRNSPIRGDYREDDLIDVVGENKDFDSLLLVDLKHR